MKIQTSCKNYLEMCVPPLCVGTLMNWVLNKKMLMDFSRILLWHSWSQISLLWRRLSGQTPPPPFYIYQIFIFKKGRTGPAFCGPPTPPSLALFLSLRIVVLGCQDWVCAPMAGPPLVHCFNGSVGWGEGSGVVARPSINICWIFGVARLVAHHPFL